MRLDSGNYQEIIQSLQTDQTRVKNVQQIRVTLLEEEDNSWVLNILEDLVTAVLDEGSHLKSLDIAGSGASTVDWASLSPDMLAQVLVLVAEGSVSTRSGHLYVTLLSCKASAYQPSTYLWSTSDPCDSKLIMQIIK